MFSWCLGHVYVVMFLWCLSHALVVSRSRLDRFGGVSVMFWCLGHVLAASCSCSARAMFS